MVYSFLWGHAGLMSSTVGSVSIAVESKSLNLRPGTPQLGLGFKIRLGP